MRATLDILDRFGDGLLTLAIAVQGLLDLLRLRLRLRPLLGLQRIGLGDRLLTDLQVNKNQLGKTVTHSSLVPGLLKLLVFSAYTSQMSQ